MAGGTTMHQVKVGVLEWVKNKGNWAQKLRLGICEDGKSGGKDEEGHDCCMHDLPTLQQVVQYELKPQKMKNNTREYEPSQKSRGDSLTYNLR